MKAWSVERGAWSVAGGRRGCFGKARKTQRPAFAGLRRGTREERREEIVRSVRANSGIAAQRPGARITRMTKVPTKGSDKGFRQRVRTRAVIEGVMP
jgi:hypothetical protein